MGFKKASEPDQLSGRLALYFCCLDIINLPISGWKFWVVQKHKVPEFVEPWEICLQAEVPQSSVLWCVLLFDCFTLLRKKPA